MPANYREAQGKGVCKNIKRALLRKTPQHKLPFFTPICSRASMSSQAVFMVIGNVVIAQQKWQRKEKDLHSDGGPAMLPCRTHTRHCSDGTCMGFHSHAYVAVILIGLTMNRLLQKSDSHLR